LAQLGRGAEAIPRWHFDIHDRDVGSRRDRGWYHLVTSPNLSNDVHVLFQLKQPPHRCAKHDLILGEQDSDHAAKAPFVRRGTGAPRRT
jgi:hypothetical protein